MWKTHFINANPATIMQRLYQIKAEQDGRDVVIVAHAVKRNEIPAEAVGEEDGSRERAATKKEAFA